MGYTYIWEDHCEVLTGWTWNRGVLSLSNVDPKEGVNCFRMKEVTIGYNTWAYKNITPIGLPDTFDFLFWMKISYFYTSNHQDVWIETDPTTSVGMRIQAHVNPDVMYIEPYITGNTPIMTHTITKYVWHLIRCRVTKIGVNINVKLYVDDIYLSEFTATGAISNLTLIYIDGHQTYEIYYDWFRVGVYSEEDTGGGGSVALKSVVGDCCGVISLYNVLGWHEEEEVPIPVKRIIRKESPTTQAGYFTRLPRRIELELKSSKSEKVALEDCKHCHGWLKLYDYDRSFVDAVWIERLNYRWLGDEDHHYSWRGRMTLLCSST